MYPVTICPARYSGVYEGARWVAFPFHAAALAWEADGWDGDDMEAVDYWSSSRAVVVGRGATPDEAYADLERRSVNGS
jgi:hypothetical protein